MMIPISVRKPAIVSKNRLQGNFQGVGVKERRLSLLLFARMLLGGHVLYDRLLKKVVSVSGGL